MTSMLDQLRGGYSRSGSHNDSRNSRGGSRNSREKKEIRSGMSRNSRRNDHSPDEEEGSRYDLHTVDTAESDIDSPNPSSMKKQNKKREATEDYQLQEGAVNGANNDDGSVSSAVRRGNIDPDLHFKQRYAPFSTFFCAVQCIVLPLMIWQCGIAPMNINPMIGPYPVSELNI